MSYKTKNIDNITINLLKKAEDLLIKAINPLFVLRKFKIDSVKYLLMSNDLEIHISGCKEIVFFAATIGNKIDEIIHKVKLEDVALSFCLDAMADTAIENLCDEIEIITRSKECTITERFSPGYGDWDISVQENILSVLNAQKSIGLTCNEKSILIPRKSVTAIIGVYTPYISR